MHVDRRKSDLDVIEHVALGVRRTHLFAERRTTTPVTDAPLTPDVKQ
jgi:alkylated DNA repair dioxygenase AlkB